MSKVQIQEYPSKETLAGLANLDATANTQVSIFEGKDAQGVLAKVDELISTGDVGDSVIVNIDKASEAEKVALEAAALLSNGKLVCVKGDEREVARENGLLRGLVLELIERRGEAFAWMMKTLATERPEVLVYEYTKYGSRRPDGVDGEVDWAELLRRHHYQNNLGGLWERPGEQQDPEVVEVRETVLVFLDDVRGEVASELADFVLPFLDTPDHVDDGSNDDSGKSLVTLLGWLSDDVRAEFYAGMGKASKLTGPGAYSPRLMATSALGEWARAKEAGDKPSTDWLGLFNEDDLDEVVDVRAVRDNRDEHLRA